MDLRSALKILGCFIIVLGGILGIILYRVRDEKRYYSGYTFSNKNKYKYLPKYEAYIENGSSIYQTNMVYLYITFEYIVVQKQSIKKGYYSIVYNLNNTISIIIQKEECLGGYKYKLSIDHNEKNIKSPCEVTFRSYIDENVLSMIENLSKNSLSNSNK